MIHLTQKEKADRFDALQVAFNITKQAYNSLQIEASKRYKSDDVISAYNKGLSDAYIRIIEDIERWIV